VRPSLLSLMSAALLPLLGGCIGLPAGVEPVKPLELPRYLGKWYEIARLDHSFERGMEQTSAEYSLRDDGGVRVLNRGFKTAKQKWSSAEGKAYFVRGQDEGFLKVSFFGPFYGAYAVFELDSAYTHAFISGGSTDYLWLLARTPTVDDSIKARFVERSRALGFPVDQLIWVKQVGAEVSKGAGAP